MKDQYLLKLKHLNISISREDLDIPFVIACKYHEELYRNGKWTTNEGWVTTAFTKEEAMKIRDFINERLKEM